MFFHGPLDLNRIKKCSFRLKNKCTIRRLKSFLQRKVLFFYVVVSGQMKLVPSVPPRPKFLEFFPVFFIFKSLIVFELCSIKRFTDIQTVSHYKNRLRGEAYFRKNLCPLVPPAYTQLYKDDFCHK